MKKLFFVGFIVILASCAKDNTTPPPVTTSRDIASAYKGDYLISETVYDWWSYDLLSQSNFTGKIYGDVELIANLPIGMRLEDTLNVVAFDQLSRPTPYPAWALPEWAGVIGAGILTYKFYSINGRDTLMGIPGTVTDGRVISKDTLFIHYDFGSGSTYHVNQVWVRKK